MKIIRFLFFSLFAFPVHFVFAQPYRWQQHVNYNLKIDMDVKTNKYTGKEKLVYTNNSPDTLKRVFFHLYANAFQPNSMMDVRSRRQGTIVLGRDRNGNEVRDWDSRVRDRILNLKPEETGYENVSSIRLNGRLQKTKLHETILEVDLDKDILPSTTALFEIEFDAQVPLQVRRSGRDNPATGVRYTMTQWYPKICEYDYEGWHPTPYIGREFYGVWGGYDVTITIDKNYILGGSGTIQNANEVGFGYEQNGIKVNKTAGEKLNWHFIAPKVHDFAWAADPDFKHIVRKTRDGITINVLYKGHPTPESFSSNAGLRSTYNNNFDAYTADWDKQWETLAEAAVAVYPFIKIHYGPYPYPQYSFIHGGDGGMEYPNCTMISVYNVSSAFHEWMHSWYQGMMGTNESLYPWMDEGFTQWAEENLVETYGQSVLRNKTDPAAARTSDSLHAIPPINHHGIYNGYLNLVKSGKEEAMSTHSDHYNTNYAYGNAAYSKGGVFLEQLGYIVGTPARDKILLEYYKQWRFRHPNPNDFIRIAEKVSEMKLDWYQEYWINTTKTIDYGIDSLYELNGATTVRLRDIGLIPMPVDVRITFRDGSSEWHYIPMSLMYGEKPAEEDQQLRKVYSEWKWTDPTYEISTSRHLTEIDSVEIDPSYRMADTDRKNNKLVLKW